ncbi:hypothetical protein Clacol_005924 [Clathrus columnatus]|uniref:Uncharacterized protein n=1 Tax=Clathrus columnatus TaxID=1419009 RepID=A0AAV5ADW4_9AGAM|nr:hypothetical protein Clacol_005924 [Clathrus columnatus]
MANILSNNPFRTPPQLSPQNTNASVNSRAGVVDTPISSGITQDNNLFDTIPDEAPPPYTLEEETPTGLGHSSQPFQEPPLPDLPPRIQTFNSVPTNIVQPSIRINDNQLEPSEVRNPQQPPLPPRHPITTTISPTTNTNTNRRSASVSSPTSPVSPTRSRSERLSVSYLPPPGPPPPGNSGSEGRSQVFDPPSGPPSRHAVSSSASSSNRLSNNSKNVGYRNNDPSHPCMKCWNKYARSYSGALAYAPFPSASPNGVSSSSSSSSNFQRPLPKLQPPHGSSASSSRPATQKPPQPGQARLRRRSQSESKLNGGNNNNINITSSSMSSLSPASPRINANTNTSSRTTTSAPHSPVTQRPVNHINRIPAYSSTRTPTPRSPPTQRPVLTNRQSCISTRPPPIPQTPISPGGGGRATIYQAGDPRLGGRLCWRCDGRGRISYFLFDSTTCEICGGIGRTFN